MSDSSPQLAQLLLPGAVLPGQPGAPGQLRPQAPRGVSPESAGALVDTGFQQQLQALLNGVQSAPDAFAAGLPGALEAGRGPAALSDLSAVQQQSSDPLQQQAPAADGKLLPEGGNILPLPLTAQGTTAAVATGADSNIRLTDVATAPLNNGRAAVAQQLSVRTGGGESAAANTAGEQAEALTEQRALPELQRQTAVIRDGADNGARLNAGQVAATSANASPVADVLRRVQSAEGGRDRTTLAGIEARVAELASLGKARDGVVRVPAAGDSAAAQFNLHARPEGLLQPGALTPEAALRDLAAMTPLRPQSGEGAAGWSAGLGQRLLMMAENGIETARLRLNPASLGPLDIQVNVEDDQARVWFGAQNTATRDALEAALPRLRELFAEQGLQLAQADVGERGADGRRSGQ